MTNEEMMDAMCKFRVTQTVYTKVAVELVEREITGKKKRRLADPQPLQVIERVVSQCHGGIQMAYILRPHIADRWAGTVGAASDFQRMMEIELTDKFPEWPTDETPEAE
jgi:hypothetical protein